MHPSRFPLEPPPEFGHGMLKYFGFDSKYTNLNNGSYGSLPLPVRATCDDLATQVEANPDLFMRRRFLPLLADVRARLACLVGAAHADECVMVPNVSHGLNTVLRNVEWAPGDVIITTSTTYDSISRTAQYLADTPPHPSISMLKLRFPSSRSEILSLFRTHIRSIPRTTTSSAQPCKIAAIIDSIVALPGILLPWQEMVRICREEGVLSIVDAAHSIGQEVDINLGQVQPDFWVSNCHKWLFAKRTCAILYVPKRNQHIIRSTFPTSYAYESPQVPDRDNFVAQFDWPSTTDPVPYLSVMAALDFRSWLGGEAKINDYCHSLAVAGGRRLAWLLGTRVMDESNELTANMTNVELPVPGTVKWSAEVDELFRYKLLEELFVWAVPFVHDERWWIRCCAQIWNEISDFDVLARALTDVCAEIRKNDSAIRHAGSSR